MGIARTYKENGATWPSSPSQSAASWGDEHIQKVLQASGRQGAEQQMLLAWSPAEDGQLSLYTIMHTYIHTYIYT